MFYNPFYIRVRNWSGASPRVWNNLLPYLLTTGRQLQIIQRTIKNISVCELTDMAHRY